MVNLMTMAYGAVADQFVRWVRSIIAVENIGAISVVMFIKRAGLVLFSADALPLMRDRTAPFSASLRSLHRPNYRVSTVAIDAVDRAGLKQRIQVGAGMGPGHRIAEEPVAPFNDSTGPITQGEMDRANACGMKTRLRQSQVVTNQAQHADILP